MTDIVDRVRKLLQLSQSSNQNEALAATAIANKLIAEHNISVAELEINGGNVEPVVESDTFIYETGRIIPWKQSLAVILAKNYGCAIFNSLDYSGGRKFSRLKLVGRASDIGICNYMFAWLVTTIQTLSDAECKGKGKVFAQSYCQGFVSGIQIQLTVSKKEAESGFGVAAIVRVNSRLDEAEKWMRAQHQLKKEKHASHSRFDLAAYGQGVEAGKNIHLGKSLNSGVKALPSGKSRN